MSSASTDRNWRKAIPYDRPRAAQPFDRAHHRRCAITVHTALGPGLLESAYEVCLAYELVEQGLSVEQQQAVPLTYKQVCLDCGYRLDLLVESVVIVEIKAVEKLTPVHQAQLMLGSLGLWLCLARDSPRRFRPGTCHITTIQGKLVSSPTCD